MANSQQYGNDTQDTNPVDRASRNNGKTRLMDKNEVLIDPATDETLSSTLSREISQWSAGVLPVEQDSPVALEDTSGAQVDPATDTTLSSTLSREISQWSAGTVPTALEDTTGTQVDPLAKDDAAVITASDSGTGSGNAAQLDLGPIRSSVDVHVDTSGAATLTVEVSTDGNNWRTYQTVDYGSGTATVEHFNTASGQIRAYLDSNRNLVEMSAKGL